MTITELERSLETFGLRSQCYMLNAHSGEVPIQVTDIEGNNRVTLRFPYKGLDDHDLPGVLVHLYFSELRMRKAKKMAKAT